MLNNYELLLLDYDGTLCDTHEAIAFCLKNLFESEISLSLSMDDLYRHIGSGSRLDETIQALHPKDLTEEEVAYWKQKYRALYSAKSTDYVKLFPGVYKFMRELTRYKKSAIILSNKGVEAIRASVSKFGLENMVLDIIGDAPGIPRKPDPGLYEQIVRPRFPSITNKKVLMVGDTLADIQFANSCGIASAWASWGYGDKEQCMAANPTHVLTNAIDLLH
jgi:phosphoglycolate phosphatase